MPKPVLLRLLLKVLQQNGFSFISQRGSHAKFEKGNLTTIVPMHGKEVPYGTFKSVLKQSKLSEEYFRK